jgi:hypothetical protein
MNKEQEKIRDLYIKEVLIPQMHVVAESCADEDRETGVFALSHEEAQAELISEFEDKFDWEQDELEDLISDVLAEYKFAREDYEYEED